MYEEDLQSFSNFPEYYHKSIFNSVYSNTQNVFPSYSFFSSNPFQYPEFSEYNFDMCINNHLTTRDKFPNSYLLHDHNFYNEATQLSFLQTQQTISNFDNFLNSSLIVNSDNGYVQSHFSVGNDNKINYISQEDSIVDHNNIENSQTRPLEEQIIKEVDKPCCVVRNSKTNKESTNSFICSVCSKVFPSRVSMVKHLKIHSSVKPFCCEHCGKTFSTKQNLISHMVRVHRLETESNKYCPHCGKLFFLKKIYTAHLLLHNQIKSHKCNICGKRFRYEESKARHEISHTGEFLYSCALCDRKFETRATLKRHLRRDLKEHKQVKYSINATASITSNSAGSELPQQFYDQFERSFTDTSRYQLNTAVLKRQEAVRCSYEECNGKIFSNLNLLRNHIRRKHNSYREKFYCDKCSAVYLKKSSLCEHMNKVHSLIRTKHNCSLCAKTFTNLSGLKQHIRLHSQVSNYKCSICSKLFRRSDVLKKHILIHSKNNGGQFSCEKCGKHFKSPEALSYHEASHDGKFNFTCEVCGKGFVRKCHLDSHLKLHMTGDKRPYVCHICHKTYRSNKNLKEHMKLKHHRNVLINTKTTINAY